MKYGRRVERETEIKELQRQLKEPRPERLAVQIANELLELKPGEYLAYDNAPFGIKWAVLMCLYNNADRFQFAETEETIYVYRDKE